MKLNGLRAALSNLFRVHGGVDVGLHNTDLVAILEHVDGAQKSGRFAAAGGGHEVHKAGVLFFQLCAELVRLAVVVFENAFFDFNDSNFIHLCFLHLLNFFFRSK